MWYIHQTKITKEVGRAYIVAAKEKKEALNIIKSEYDYAATSKSVKRIKFPFEIDKDTVVYSPKHYIFEMIKQKKYASSYSRIMYNETDSKGKAIVQKV